MSRTAIVIIVLILCIAGVILLLRQGQPPQDVLTQAEQISVTGYGETGKPSWSIQARSGTLNAADSSLVDVELKLLANPDAPTVIQADRLSRSSAGSELSGSISVTQADGISLSTDVLFWDEHNDVLESGPVTIDMDATSIMAGAFHHRLDTGLTILSQGVEAQITRDNVAYNARSDSAETTSDLVVLIGHVTIETDDGDSYSCLRLESDLSTSSIRLIGGVVGRWQQNDFSAETVLLDGNGIRFHGNVTTDLDLLMMEASHDS